MQETSAVDAIPIPPDEIRVGKERSYRRQGRRWVKLFAEEIGLDPDAAVLEVGCGTGRIAGALAGCLSPAGTYEGFDIVESSVEWCRREISTRFPNFRFQRANVHNGVYNPDGEYAASEYRFPYPDDRFDFAFLTSIFTHMLPDDVDNYLREIARALKPGGRSLITYFLLNDEARELIAAGRARPKYRSFAQRGEGFQAVPENDPEGAVALEEDWVRERYAAAGLAIEEPIRYGRWCGRTDSLRNQDMVIASKVG